MFYEEKQIDKILRFGDIVRGYLYPQVKIKQPFLSLENSIYHNYVVNFEVPVFSVILTPCCSIGEQNLVCMSPLIQLKKDFFKNPYLIEDFTRLNREIDPDKVYAPEDWMKKPDEERQKLIAKGRGYTEYYLFIYAPCDAFPPYERRKQETKYYMVDFRNIQTLKCDLIKGREDTIEEDGDILASKCMQLSRQTRRELRLKLSHYFGRVPIEDEIE
jgi:hypothetical protein